MNRPLEELTNEELEQGAWHDLSVAGLVELHNPLCAWVELESPLTIEEVQACLDAGQEELCHTPLWTALVFDDILPALKDGVSVRGEKFGGGC